MGEKFMQGLITPARGEFGANFRISRASDVILFFAITQNNPKHMAN